MWVLVCVGVLVCVLVCWCCSCCGGVGGVFVCVFVLCAHKRAHTHQHTRVCACVRACVVVVFVKTIYFKNVVSQGNPSITKEAFCIQKKELFESLEKVFVSRGIAPQETSARIQRMCHKYNSKHNTRTGGPDGRHRANRHAAPASQPAHRQTACTQTDFLIPHVQSQKQPMELRRP